MVRESIKVTAINMKMSLKNHNIVNVSKKSTKINMNKKIRRVLILTLSILSSSCTMYEDQSYTWECSPCLDSEWRTVHNQQKALALIQKGKELNPVDGASPLLYAPSFELKKLLLQHGANPNHVPQYLKNPPSWWKENVTDLHPMLGIRSDKEGRLLLKYGGKVPANALVNFNRQFVSSTREGDNPDAAKLFLIKHGADVRLDKYKNGDSEHILNLLNSSPILTQDMLKYFEKCGVDLSAAQMNQIKKPGTPYIFDNCFENQLELLKGGVNPNLRDPFTGDTLLIYDLRQVERKGGADFNTGRLYHFIKKLLEMGADPTLKNDEGRTAMSYAYKDRSLLKLLSRHGGNEQELEEQGAPVPESLSPHPIIYRTFMRL